MSLRRLLLAAACLALLLAGWITYPGGVHSDDADRSMLGSLVSRALSTPSNQVSIGSVEGALSSDATIRNITISDSEGVWLRLDSARLVWRRLALLSGRLDIDKLEIGKLEVLRPRIATEEPVPGADQPLLPELPVEVIVRDFKLQDLALGQPFLGVPVQLTASGNARLGDPAQGLSLRFDARRIDAPGTFTANLGLVPKTEALTLGLTVNEPEGGVLARLASIPGLPPVQLDLKGDGTLSAFAAKLNFDAGPDIGAVGGANLARNGAQRDLTLTMDARIAGMLPAPAAPVFAGSTKLGGVVSFQDDGGTRIDDVNITSRLARLAINGTVAKDRNLDIKVQVASLPNTGEGTKAGDAEIGKLAFDATIAGPVSQPTINASLDLQKARLPSGSFGNAQARFTANSTGALADRSSRLVLAGDAKVSGIALADAGLAQAVGDNLAFTLRGSVDRTGIADVEELRLTASTLDAGYQGKLGAREVNGRATLTESNLSRLSKLTGLKLRGAIATTADVSGAPRYSRLTARLTGNATSFGTGIAPVDNLAGGKLSLNGAVRTMPRGGFGFDDLVLAGSHASARVNGEVGAADSVTDARIAIDDLSRADPRLTGKAEATARLTGPLDNANATARIALSNASAMGRPVPKLALDVTAKDLLGMLDMQANLDGLIAQATANGKLHVAKRPEGGWLVDNLALTVGSVAIDGGVTLDAANLADGRLSIRAGNLDDISALVLIPLRGDLAADISLSSAGGGQSAMLNANGNRLRFGDTSIEQLAAKISASDVFRRPVIDGNASVQRASIAGQEVSQIKLDAKGTMAASDVTLKATAAGFDLDGRARVVPADQTRIEIGSFSARRGNRRVALAGPATITMVPGGADIRALALAVESGRVSVSGLAGSKLNLSWAVRAVPLSAAEIFVPGLGLSGVAEGEGKLAGAASSPTGDWRMRLSRVSTPDTRNAGLPAVDATASGRLGDGRTTLDASAQAGRLASVQANGSLPLDPGGRMDIAVRATGDLSVANAILAPAGRRLTGSANADMRLGGTPLQPTITGSGRIANATLSDATTGVRITAIQGSIVANGQDVVLQRLTAATPNGGTFSAEGRVRIDPQAGFPGSLRVTGRNARVMNDGTVTADADINLSLNGPLSQRPTIAGSVGIQSMIISVPEQLPGNLQPIPGTRQLYPTPQAQARIAAMAKASAQARRSPPFDAPLAIDVTVPGRITVTGRGMNAELGGQLKVTGSTVSPVPNGAFVLRRGSFQLGSTMLDFTRGRVVFSGTLSPELDFVAETQSGGVTARVAVSGPASAPVFTFSSSPDLAQDEVIARILFGQPAGELSPFQALQLAQIAGQFSGSGDGAFDQLRRSLGLSGSDVSSSANDGPLARAGRAIGNRVRFSVRPGTTPETTGIGVNVDVSRHIRVQGLVGATGNTSIGVGAEWEY